MLQRSLNTHDRIRILEEPFTREEKNNPWDFVTRPDIWLRNQVNPELSVNGAIVQDYQFAQIPDLALLSNLDPFAIVLYRMDLLAQFVSLKIAQKLHNYETNTPRTCSPTIDVDVDEFNEHCRVLLKQLKTSLRRWRRQRQLVVSYETLTHDWPSVLKAISGLLGVDVTKAPVVTFMQETRPMFMAVSNFHKVKRVSCLYETRLQTLLEWAKEIR